MRLSAAIAIGILLLVMSASASTVRVQASPPPAPASVQVLFDLGDGFYEWTSVVIPDPVAWNATWNATLDAAADVGLWIRWSWYSFGGSGAVFITDVGNRSPPGGVGIYTWNTTSHAWDAALVGISSLVLSNGDALALYDAGFDPVTFGNQYPSPTPEHPYPATEFRGDFANSGWSASSAPSGVEVLWDRNLNLREIEGTPAVAAGRVFVLTQDGLFALDESSGAVLWSNPKVAGLSSPALFNGTLIVGGSDGKVHGIDATTGLERWNATLVRKPGPSGLTSSPKVVFDTAYIGVFNESGGPGEVDALWATNGTVIWRAPAPASVSFSTPAVAEGRVFVGVIGLYNTTTGVTYAPPYGVLALNATDGSELWFHPTSGSVAASPVVYGGRVYAAAKDGLLNCMRSVNGSLLWSASVQAGVSSPALSGDVLYVGGGTFGGTGRVVAINVSSGASVWTFLPNGPVQGSITRAGGEVLFSTNAANGTLYALDASTGTLVWSYMPTPIQYIFSSPVAADGMVFAASDNGHVYAFTAAASLLDLGVTAPSSLPVAGNATFNITVRATRGAVSDVKVRLQLSNATAVVALGGGTILTGTFPGEYVLWTLDHLAFGASAVLSAMAQSYCVTGNATCVGGTFVQTVNVTYSDFYGGLEPAQSQEISVTIGGVAAAPAPFPILVPVLLAIAIVAAAVVLLVVRQRRSQRGP